MRNRGAPLATMGGRSMPCASHRERLSRQLGLDKPVLLQYFYWLVGNDWAKVDLDGDGIAESNGTRQGVLRGDLGTSLVNRGVPVEQVIWDRLPNTLILMVPSEILIIVLSLIVGVDSALPPYSLLGHPLTNGSLVGY